MKKLLLSITAILLINTFQRSECACKIANNRNPERKAITAA